MCVCVCVRDVRDVETLLETLLETLETLLETINNTIVYEIIYCIRVSSMTIGIRVI